MAKDFEEIEKLTRLGEQSLEQIDRHARINAGFHDFEQGSFASKRMIRDLCIQYQVFFEKDEKCKKFLDKMKAYAELDPYTHENYEKEVDFVSNLPKMLADMNKLVEEQEKAFRNEMKNFTKEKFDALSPEDQEKKNREYLLTQETLDNRQRALASFEVYFETTTKGNLEFMDSFDKNARERIAKANEGKGYTRLKLQNEDGDTCYYISASGAEIDYSIRLDDRNEREQEYEYLANLPISEIDRRNAPIFPHEPRMTDVAQGVSGECYLYSALQEVVRLYPQKIKDMIKDNGDGTATVRLYGKVSKEGKMPEYRPVYVRVDKTVPKIGRGGKYDRLAEDCLWVQLIEKAYALTGLHDSKGKDLNVPKDVNSSKNKNWVPSINSIEGGVEYLFMENLLGPEGEYEEIENPGYAQIANEVEAKRLALEKLDSIKNVDMKSADAIARHAFYKFYKSSGGILTEEQFMKEDEQYMISLVQTKCDVYGANDYYAEAFKAIKSTAQKLLDEYKDKPITSKMVSAKVGAMLDESIEEITGKETFVAKKKEMTKAIKDIYKEVKSGIYDMGLAADIPKTPLKDSFYDKIWACTEMGLPITCGTHQRRDQVVYADEKHAYSIIGAYKTDEEPPRYMFRVKNPHTKSEGKNGMAYTDDDGVIRGEWVNVKDGIFDMQLEDFVRDFPDIHFSGMGALESQPHQRVEGYDIIKPEDIARENEKKLTTDKLTDYMKVSNDLYDMMISTDFVFSHNSKAYDDLVEGIKIFRHNMACANGREIKDLKKLTEPLVKLVDAYETHVNGKFFGASKREKRRLNICSEIRKVADAIDKGKNPETEYEKEYAAKLVNAYYDANKIKDKSKIAEVSERMFNNKAFRTIANSTNIAQMINPDSKVMKKHLKTIEKNLEGRGIDKGVDLATMKPRTKAKKPAGKRK